MGVDEALRLPGEQETMCRAEVARLDEEQARLAGLLADCRVELERLVVAREVVAGLVPVPPVAVAASADGGVPAGESTEFGQQLLAILAVHPGRCDAARSPWPWVRTRGWPGTVNGCGIG